MHELLCLPCSEPSFLLPLTYTHGYKCSCQPCFGVSMQDTHSLACKRLFLQDSQGPPFLKIRCLHRELYNKGEVLRLPFPGVQKVPALRWEAAPLPCSAGTCRGGWPWPSSPMHVPTLSAQGGAFQATRSQCVTSLLLPAQETAATSFFNPAQVRPDFPV